MAMWGVVVIGITVVVLVVITIVIGIGILSLRSDLKKEAETSRENESTINTMVSQESQRYYEGIEKQRRSLMGVINYETSVLAGSIASTASNLDSKIRGTETKLDNRITTTHNQLSAKIQEESALYSALLNTASNNLNNRINEESTRLDGKIASTAMAFDGKLTSTAARLDSSIQQTSDKLSANLDMRIQQTTDGYTTMVNNASTSLQTKLDTAASGLEAKLATEATTLNNAIKDTSASLNTRLTSESNKLGSMIQSSTAALKTDQVALASRLDSVGNTVNGIYNTGTDTLAAREVRVKTDGSITFDQTEGMRFTNNNSSTDGSYDITAGRANIGTSLNVAGTLNFASTSASFMLGVDGTSMYLKVQQPNHAFTIRDSTNQERVNIRDSNVTIDADARIVGNLNFADTAGASMPTHVIDTSLSDLYIKPMQDQGSFTVRDSKNQDRLVVRNNRVQINGDTTATGSISAQQICSGSNCLTATDIAAIKKSAGLNA